MGRGYGLGDLGSGFLAGFQTMNDFQRGQKADAMAEKEMSLRDAMWNNTLDRQKIDDDRYKSETDYKHGRDSLADTRYDAEQKYNHKQDAIRNSLDSARVGIAKASEARQAKIDQYNLERNQRIDWGEQNKPVLYAGMQAASQGQDPGDAYWNLVNSPEGKKWGSAYDIRTYNQDYQNAGRRLLSFANDIVKAGPPDTTSKEGISALYSKVNTQQNRDDMNILYKDRIKDGVGEFDPSVGKTIKDKEFDHFIVGNDDPNDAIPDGAIGIGLKVTYDDGSTAFKPVTNLRSTDKNDMVRLFGFGDIINDVGDRTRFASQVKDRLQAPMQALGFSEGFDKKAYMKDITDAALKRDDKIAEVYAAEGVPKEEKDASVANIKANFSSTRAMIDSLYGLSSGNEADPVASWVGNDPVKRRWAMNVGNREALMQMISTGGIDSAYQDDIKAGWTPGSKKQVGGVTPKKPTGNDGVTPKKPTVYGGFKLSGSLQPPFL